jgi:threonine/homoserine/homoserine lactone efflux protein
MDGLSWLASAAGFAFAMTATPGPNNAMVAASGANYGVRRTLPHLMGIAVGFPLMLLLVALGAAGIVRDSPWLQDLMRWGGALWLLWLAWRIATAAPATPGEGGSARGRPMSFLEAALFQWVNPKAWLIAMGGIGAYVGGEGLGAALVLALLFALAAVICLLGWAALGAGMARLLLRPAAMRWFNRGVALLLVLSLLPVLAPQAAIGQR